MKLLLSLLPARAALCLLLSAAPLAAGEITSKAVDYKQADTSLEGFLAVPKDLKGKAPAILIIHDWTGVAKYSKSRAEQLAGLGYVAMVADIYGKGVRPEGPAECGKQAGLYKNDRALYRQRLLAALEELRKQPQTDTENVAAVGYCFGGTGVLELARAGADVKGVVSFHGGLDSPTPADGKNIKAKVLVLHGADDPFVPAEGLAAMEKEFKDAGVDWQLISYGGAVHSFSNPNAGTDKSKGNAYDAATDKRSWEHFRSFLAEIFGDKNP